MVALRTLRSTPAPSDRGERRFAIGEVDVTLRSDAEAAMEDFSDLYRHFRRTPGPRADAIAIDVQAAGSSPWRRKRYVLLGDGEKLYTVKKPDEILPYVEWGINWRVVVRRREFLQLHAAALVHAGRGVILAADSGAGKSILAAGLLARGWQYLGDEFALIEPDTLCLHPFPKALCIKQSGFPVIERLNLPLWRRRHFVKAFKGQVGYIAPHEVHPHAVGAPSPIRAVVFPQYVEGFRPRLVPITRAESAFRLMEAALNRNVFGPRATTILNNVVRAAQCFRLDSGRIEDTCDVIESALAEEPST